MSAKIKKYISYELECDKHNLLFRWNEEYSDESFLKCLHANGWDYIFRDVDDEIFYCPECLKELDKRR